MDNNQVNILAGGTGIAGHLTRICQMLLAISQQESDQVKKREYFEEIYEQISDDAEKLKEKINAIDNEKLPENVQQISYHISEPLVRAYLHFQEAIEYLVLYIDNEEMRFAEQAMEAVEKGAIFLDVAEEHSNQLKEVIKESGDTLQEDDDMNPEIPEVQSDGKSSLINSLSKMTSDN